MKSLFANVGADLRASVVVYLVAVPLCLGIALGSTAPLAAGVVAGIVGGLVVGMLSASPLSVSGPAAGLTAIVAAAIATMGSWQLFLTAVVLAGGLQVAAGAFRLGALADFVPNAVIRGLLAAIGVLLILKQFPHLVGFDKNYVGDLAFGQADGDNTFSTVAHAMGAIEPTAAVVGLLAMAILWLWERPQLKRVAVLGSVPGPLVAVLASVAVRLALESRGPEWHLQAEHLVQLPLVTGAGEFFSHLSSPQFSGLTDPVVWKVAFTLAIVASLETLLGVAAVDKLDALNRVTPPNRELVAQGVGNIVSGLLGGLPMTSVIVRSSANVNAGGQSRLSTVLHGAMLLASALFAAKWLNQVPLAALAAILVFTGYKLAKVEIFRDMWTQGRDQFIPFAVTIGAILLTDLLVGILVGIGVGVFFHIQNNFRTTVVMVHEGSNYLLRLRKDVSFFVKPTLRATLETIEPNAYLLVDLTAADSIDKDIVDVINEFAHHAQLRNIKLEIRRSPRRPADAKIRFDIAPAPTPVLEPMEVTP